MSLALRLWNLPRFTLGAWQLHRGTFRYPNNVTTEG